MTYQKQLEDKRLLLCMEARALACAFYLKNKPVPKKLNHILFATQSFEALEKYNPNWQNQPRTPSGNPDGGQWTSSGGGDDESSPPKRPSIEYIDDPPLESVYPVEMLIGGIGALSARSALAAIRVVAGAARAIHSSRKIQKAAKAIEDYFGGKPRVKINPAKDIVLMRGNKKIRFDVKNTAPHKEPHFHIERSIQKGRKLGWKPAGPKKRYPFKGE